MIKAEFTNNEINLLITSYLTGSIAEEDLVRLKDWINSSQENRSYFNELKNSWILSGFKNTDSFTYTEKSWNKFSQKIAHGRLKTGLRLRNQGKVNFTKYLRLAASWLLIFALGSVVTWWISGRSKETKIAAISNRIIEISTPLGARSMIIMPDSTQIWLNAGTKITYNEDYGQQTRTLNLRGEAYFKVTKDNLHPFFVNTQGISVRALVEKTVKMTT